MGLEWQNMLYCFGSKIEATYLEQCESNLHIYIDTVLKRHAPHFYAPTISDVGGTYRVGPVHGYVPMFVHTTIDPRSRSHLKAKGPVCSDLCLEHNFVLP